METKNKSVTVEVDEKPMDEYIRIGNNTFCVKVHFGALPLETILRARVLSERDRAVRTR